MSEPPLQADVETKLPAPHAEGSPPGDRSGDPDESLTGTVIDGRFAIKEKLGEGGMGTVYRAWHTLMKKSLAVKVLRPEFSDFPTLSQRFHREAQSASRIDHPGVVRTTDFGKSEDGLLFLVMEYVEGTSLGDLLQETPRLARERAIEIIKQICQALEAAHAQGVVHRDLKPDNIMLVEGPDGEEQVKILDFGIAKIAEGHDPAKGLTHAGMVFGTPAYMSPEQAAGDTVDARSDVYSVGILLYEMLAGKKPFDAPTMAKLIVQQIAQTAPSFREVTPEAGIPLELEAIVARALDKDPLTRFQTARELHDALEGHRRRVASGETPAVAATVAPMPLPPRPVPPAPAAKRRARLIGIAVGGGAALILTILLLVLAGGDREKKQGAWGMKARPIASGPIKRAPQSRVQEVGALLATKKIDAALVKLKELLTRYPRDARLHLLEGHACRKKRRRRECLASFDQAARHDWSTRRDKEVLALVYDLLTDRRSGRKRSAEHRQAALDFVTRHYEAGPGLDAATVQTFTRYVNRYREAGPIWKVIGILEQHSADRGIDYVHAYRQRFASEPSCAKRRRFIAEIIGRKSPKFIPLLQEIIRRRALATPFVRRWVKNACIQEDARQAILALGGKESDIPGAGSPAARRPASKRKRGVGSAIRNLFQ